MRYVLIALGIVTIALGVVLAVEGLWWAAIPDAAFGVAVGTAAWLSLREDWNAQHAPTRGTLSPEARLKTPEATTSEAMDAPTLEPAEPRPDITPLAGVESPRNPDLARRGPGVRTPVRPPQEGAAPPRSRSAKRRQQRKKKRI